MAEPTTRTQRHSAALPLRFPCSHTRHSPNKEAKQEQRETEYLEATLGLHNPTIIRFGFAVKEKPGGYAQHDEGAWAHMPFLFEAAQAAQAARRQIVSEKPRAENCE